MIQIFQDIVAGDLGAVRAQLEKKPSLISAVAKGSPKRYVGQSPLQVAIWSKHPEIAMFLLSQGADPNHVDVEATGRPSRPLLQDALDLAVVNVERVPGDARRRLSDEWFALVEALLEAGADVHVTSEVGLTALGTTAQTARDMLPPRDFPNQTIVPTLDADLTRLFDALYARGADPNTIEPIFGRSSAEHYSNSLVSKYLRR